MGSGNKKLSAAGAEGAREKEVTGDIQRQPGARTDRVLSLKMTLNFILRSESLKNGPAK